MTIEAHRSDCPRMKDWTYAYGYAMAQELGTFLRAPEICRCTVSADLAALVAAARAEVQLGTASGALQMALERFDKE